MKRSFNSKNKINLSYLVKNDEMRKLYKCGKNDLSSESARRRSVALGPLSLNLMADSDKYVCSDWIV